MAVDPGSGFAEFRARFLGVMDQYLQTSDPAPTLAPDRLTEAALLLRLESDYFQQSQDPSRIDLPVLMVLAWLHGCRSSWGPDDARGYEQFKSFAIYRVVRDQFADAIPESVAEALDSLDPANEIPVLLQRVSQIRDPEGLELAIFLLRLAIAAAPGRHDHLSNLGSALILRAGLTADPELKRHDLQEAVQTCSDAVAAGTGRPEYLTNLGLALSGLAELSGEHSVAALRKAAEVSRQACELLSAGDPRFPQYQSNLGIVLADLYERTGDVDALDDALRSLRAAVATAAPTDPSRYEYQGNLAMVLAVAFERDGKDSDLDEAIRNARAVVRDAPSSHPRRLNLVSALAGTLMAQFERTAAMSTLDEAIDVLRQVAADDLIQSNLAVALHRRFERLRNPADLTEAVMASKAALAATPHGHARWPVRAGSYGNMLRLQAVYGDKPDALDEAVEVLRDAARTTSVTERFYSHVMTNFGLALHTLADRTSDHDLFVEAAGALRKAVDAVPARHPDRAEQLRCLARSLAAQNDPAALTEALGLLREASGMVVAAPRRRAEAAAMWGAFAASVGRWQDALEGFATAVEILPLLAARFLDRSDQEHGLARRSGVASDAAACALQCGQPERAVELLEWGRGVLYAQALEAGDDLAELRQQYPEIADSLLALRAELDSDVSAADTAAVDRRYAAAREWDELTAEVRRKDGFTRFLMPPKIADILAAVGAGPVVVVNVSVHRCDALVLADGRIEVVELRGASGQQVADQASKVVTAMERAQRDADAAELDLLDVLDWTWTALVRPVLDRLPDAERVWWCPAGPASFLPLHAAGDALDRVVSSYTPTVRALRHARTERAAAAGGLLVVAVPSTPGFADLPATVREATLLAEQFPDAQALVDTSAIRKYVLTALPQHRWAHFACHAHSDLENPSASCLMLQDEPLRLVEITRLRLQGAELAFLSACGTARASGQLADEAIHVASAFQLAGYRHVVGTLWSLRDDVAAQAAELFYAAIGTMPTPMALHTVVLRLREQYRAQPTRWAVHIHLGP